MKRPDGDWGSKAGDSLDHDSKAILKRIGFVGYDGVRALDLFGPVEVFGTANNLRKDRTPAYELILLSASGEPFMLEQNIPVTPHASLQDALPLDTLIVPGGVGARDPQVVQPIVEWLKAHERDLRRTASVCVGGYILAAAGLLDGRQAATHWAFVEDFSRRFPTTHVKEDSIFVQDGAVYTSAGVTTGIDLCLYLVEEDLGSEVALAAARTLVVYLKRSGSQSQYSEPLRFQTRAADQFGGLANWMLQNLRGDMSVEALAKHCNLSPRQFSRRFKDTFGASPGEYVEHLRLDEARRRLSDNKQSLERIAESVGYASADAFRRAFERRFNIPPTAYRHQFSSNRPEKSAS
jgi:transcriptional regulator GlxA family with amidase domain